VRPTVKILAMCLLLAGTARAGDEAFRFPMPEFDSGYQYPVIVEPAPELASSILDITVLFGALSLSALFALKWRSRSGLLALSVACLLYFGFWRQGCVCPVGSVQNVTAAVFDSSAAVPLVVLAFFLLPLTFALFFGRVFCASVCPLGAIQELVAIRPVQLSLVTDQVLGLFRYVYLGLTVLGVGTGAGYLICRYDPFVGFFRQGASLNMFLVGGILLLIGVFIGRPYCRFLCPYGVLLGWLSRFSKWHARIFPTACIQCDLCKEACPYGAIELPTPEERPLSRRQGARTLGILILGAPLLIGFGAWVGMRSHEVLTRLHPTVQLAERVAAENRGEYAEMTLESEAFRGSQQTLPSLILEARATKESFRHGSGWLGAFLGLVVAARLTGLSVVRRRVDYEPDRSTCVSCARCYKYCPVEGEDASL